MRKFPVFVLLIALSPVVTGQTAKVDKAASQLEQYKEKSKAKYLESARRNIDAASVDASTRDQSRTWLVRGEVYFASYEENYAQQKEKFKDLNPEARVNKCFVTTDDAFLDIATQSFIQAQSLDKEGTNAVPIRNGLHLCSIQNTYAGQAWYQNGNFLQAMYCFERVIRISESLGVPDTSLMYNAALAGWKAKQYGKAIGWLNVLTAVNYENASCWWILAKCHLENGDPDQSARVLKQGLVKNPGSFLLISTFAEVKLVAGDSVAADSTILAFVGGSNLTPAELNFHIGNVYDQLANPEDAYDQPLPKPASYELFLGRAAVYYGKAVSLKPDYFDAMYNLGILYYNWGAEYYNRTATDSADARTYDSKWQPLLQTAIVYLERARALNPKDLNTLKGLKTCYGQLGDVENYSRIRDEIGKVEGK